MSEAREVILARIAAAHASAPPPDLPYAEITRAYRDHPPSPGADLVELLVDRLIDYRARVRVVTADELPVVITAVLAEAGVRSLAVPVGVPTGRLPDVVQAHRDEPPLTVAELDAVDGVMTGCAVAMAETGTLVLDASPDQGRRALTLVPDYHLCVVRVDAIVPNVPEALARLTPTRPLTMISGPSATSDIELERVEGVHGPRTLQVLIVV